MDVRCVQEKSCSGKDVTEIVTKAKKAAEQIRLLLHAKVSWSWKSWGGPGGLHANAFIRFRRLRVSENRWESFQMCAPLIRGL